jgi:sugar phosphate isomerase/epimerase
MRSTNRRTFLKGSAAAAIGAGLLSVRRLAAENTSPVIGLELYTVGADMKKDPAGTLKKVAAVGYTEVELTASSMGPAKELRQMLDDNGLKNPAGHFMLAELQDHFDEKLEGARILGQTFLVTTVPGVPTAPNAAPATGMMGFLNRLNNMTLDDWKWNAEQYNKLGEKVKAAGMQLGYHNHNIDFHPYGSTTGYDEFLRLTDGDLVKLELDCGWMTVAGHDPVRYLKKYPERYLALHMKDFKKGFSPITTLGPGPGAPVGTELGHGAIDYAPILAAARKTHVRTVYVEQEPPFTDMPALESMKVDYAYLKALLP